MRSSFVTLVVSCSMFSIPNFVSANDDSELGAEMAQEIESMPRAQEPDPIQVQTVNEVPSFQPVRSGSHKSGGMEQAPDYPPPIDETRQSSAAMPTPNGDKPFRKSSRSGRKADDRSKKADKNFGRNEDERKESSFSVAEHFPAANKKGDSAAEIERRKKAREIADRAQKKNGQRDYHVNEVPKRKKMKFTRLPAKKIHRQAQTHVDSRPYKKLRKPAYAKSAKLRAKSFRKKQSRVREAMPEKRRAAAPPSATLDDMLAEF